MLTCCFEHSVLDRGARFDALAIAADAEPDTEFSAERTGCLGSLYAFVEYALHAGVADLRVMAGRKLETIKLRHVLVIQGERGLRAAAVDAKPAHMNVLLSPESFV